MTDERHDQSDMKGADAILWVVRAFVPAIIAIGFAVAFLVWGWQ